VIANLFRQVANVERYHEQRYNRFLSNLEAGTVFRRDAPVKWYCRECGYVYEGTAAPQKCPACGHPEAYFEIYAENF
jgi:rubrerythrin